MFITFQFLFTLIKIKNVIFHKYYISDDILTNIENNIKFHF